MTSLSDIQQRMVLTNHTLYRYLESLLEEQQHTPRSWLYDGEKGNKFLEPDAILELWTLTLEHKLQVHGDKFLENVFKFDTAQVSKWGPQGGHAPISELLHEIVLPSFKIGKKGSTPPAFATDAWREAKNRFRKKLLRHGVARLRRRSYERAIENMDMRDSLESSSGYPVFERRNKPAAMTDAVQAASNGAWKTYPAIALFRTYNGKTRLVWIFPFAANLVEATYYQVIAEAIMRSPELSQTFFSPWKGFEQVRQVISQQYATGMQVAASDFTSTDAHFQLDATLEVYDVIKDCFQPQERAGLLESLTYMHEIPLMVGPTKMLTGTHGVSSGSNWTNFVETIFDGILGEYVSLLTKGAVHVLYAIGDDMAWVSKHFRASFKDELEEIGKSVGQIIKAEKTTVFADKVKSLQRLFQRGYFISERMLRAVYSTVRALKSSVYPERWHKPPKWNSDMFCARQFMILENTVDHPLFEDFVRFICKGNRHLIPFAQKSGKQLDLITRKAKLIPGLNPTYNQEKKDSSLSNFASIRVARKLA